MDRCLFNLGGLKCWNQKHSRVCLSRPFFGLALGIGLVRGMVRGHALAVGFDLVLGIGVVGLVPSDGPRCVLGIVLGPGPLLTVV